MNKNPQIQNTPSNTVNIFVGDYHSSGTSFCTELITNLDHKKLSRAIGDQNIHFQVYHQAKEAQSSIEHNDFDLCIVNSLDCIHLLRSNGHTAAIIFIANERSLSKAALMAGATDFIDKQNLNNDSLYLSISYHLNAQHFKSKRRVVRSQSNDISSIICEIKPNGELLFINSSSSKITGFPTEQLKGAVFQEAFQAKKNGLKLPTDYFQNIAEKKTQHCEKELIQIKTKNSSYKSIDWSICPNYDPDGNIFSLVLKGEDVSDAISVLNETNQLLIFDSQTGLRNKEGLVSFAKQSINKKTTLFIFRAEHIDKSLRNQLTDFINDHFKQTDIKAYLGNAGFAVLCENSDQDQLEIIKHKLSYPELSIERYSDNIEQVISLL